MTVIELYEKIIDSILVAASEATGEVDIVKKSIDKINDQTFDPTFDPNIKVQTGFCHQKPYALFVNPLELFTKKRTELGDYLFVIKYLDNNKIIDKRALFFQAKYSPKNDPYHVELHQFHFYRQIENLEFKFGNSVYKKLKSVPITWKNISKPNEFGDYMMISAFEVTDLYTNEIASQYSHKKSGYFTYKLRLLCNPRFHLGRGYQETCSRNINPLFDFLKPFGKGNKIEGNFETFIDLIYKKLEILPDPPEEHEGFWEEGDNGGFGLIEITINNMENNKE